MADDIAPEVRSWLDAFADRLGVQPPSDDDIRVVLALAGAAARGSARQAAPVACWLAAHAGVEATAALAIAGEL
jgi:Domain of unknown function (DUF6457)